jgi:hypothetical protein
MLYLLEKKKKKKRKKEGVMGENVFCVCQEEGVMENQ